VNPTNKKPSGALRLKQQLETPTRAAHQFKPAAAQLKNAGAAQSIKKPVASPVNRLQAKPVAGRLDAK
jgi:hypothetical protein